MVLLIQSVQMFIQAMESRKKMINPKQKFIEIIFGPVINFFEKKLVLSGGFVGVIFLVIISIPFFRVKGKNTNDRFRKILIIVTLVLGIVFSIYDTLKIRGIIQ